MEQRIWFFQVNYDVMWVNEGEEPIATLFIPIGECYYSKFRSAIII